MNKNELIDKVAQDSGFSKQDSQRILDATLSIITETLKAEGDVRLLGFGTFTSSQRAATTVRNPRTGAMINVPPSRQPKFRAGKALKEALNS